MADIVEKLRKWEGREIGVEWSVLSSSVAALRHREVTAKIARSIDVMRGSL